MSAKNLIISSVVGSLVYFLSGGWEYGIKIRVNKISRSSGEGVFSTSFCLLDKCMTIRILCNAFAKVSFIPGLFDQVEAFRIL